MLNISITYKMYVLYYSYAIYFLILSYSHSIRVENTNFALKNPYKRFLKTISWSILIKKLFLFVLMYWVNWQFFFYAQTNIQRKLTNSLLPGELDTKNKIPVHTNTSMNAPYYYPVLNHYKSDSKLSNILEGQVNIRYVSQGWLMV